MVMPVSRTSINSAGDCVVLQAQEAHHLRAGDPPPVVLLVGAIPAGAELWNPESAASGSRRTGRPSAHCGEETAADIAPDAASMSARNAVQMARL